jgi:methyltransferase (TIGR00027 family)
MNQIIQHVSDTAFLVAGFRALESDRPEPLFRDPLAWTLAGDHGRQILETVPKAFVGGWSVVIRTVIIDQFIKEAIEQGVDTILNLGAGLDTRPYRMELPNTLRWVEVDFPHVIDLKESRLADERPNCRLDRIRLDLTDRALRQQLLAEVSESAEKILVLTEGVVPYLSNSDVFELADDLRAVEKIRFWIVDYFSPQALRYGRKHRTRFMRNAPFQFEPPNWFAFFDKRGWRASEVRYIAEEAERLGRPIPLPLHLKLWLNLAGLFVSRSRRERMKRFAAYVLLTPR